MAISIKVMQHVLGELSVLLPMHQEARENAHILPDLWSAILDDYSDQELLDAHVELRKTLKEFPAPADFAQHMDNTRSKGSTHPESGQ